MSIIIVFNLALAYHLAALECDSPGLLLRKSVKLYQLALTLQSEGACAEEIAIFSLVVSNNLGYAYKVLEEDELANRCFQRLLAGLMLIVDSRRKQKTPIVVEFFKNASQLMFGDGAAAAA